MQACMQTLRHMHITDMLFYFLLMTFCRKIKICKIYKYKIFSVFFFFKELRAWYDIRCLSLGFLLHA